MSTTLHWLVHVDVDADERLGVCHASAYMLAGGRHLHADELFHHDAAGRDETTMELELAAARVLAVLATKLEIAARTPMPPPSGLRGPCA